MKAARRSSVFLHPSCLQERHLRGLHSRSIQSACDPCYLRLMGRSWTDWGLTHAALVVALLMGAVLRSPRSSPQRRRMTLSLIARCRFTRRAPTTSGQSSQRQSPSVLSLQKSNRTGVAFRGATGEGIEANETQLWDYFVRSLDRFLRPAG